MHPEQAKQTSFRSVLDLFRYHFHIFPSVPCKLDPLPDRAEVHPKQAKQTS